MPIKVTLNNKDISLLNYGIYSSLKSFMTQSPGFGFITIILKVLRSIFFTISYISECHKPGANTIKHNSLLLTLWANDLNCLTQKGLATFV
jgi:hypothetical protein